MRAAAKQTLGAATRAVSPKVTERARMLTIKYKRSDSIPPTKSLPIATRCPFRNGLALSGAYAPAPPKGEPKVSPFGSNNDDRRQWRKQGVAVGAAASKTQVLFKARSGCWVPQPGQWQRASADGEVTLILPSRSFPASDSCTGWLRRKSLCPDCRTGTPASSGRPLR